MTDDERDAVQDLLLEKKWAQDAADQATNMLELEREITNRLKLEIKSLRMCIRGAHLYEERWNGAERCLICKEYKPT